MVEIKPKYARAEQLCRDGIKNGLSMFYTLEKWSLSLRAGLRLAWMMCWGIPLHAWDVENITKIVNGIGEVLNIDENVGELHRLDRSRVLLKTPLLHVINHIVTTFINGVAHG